MDSLVFRCPWTTPAAAGFWQRQSTGVVNGLMLGEIKRSLNTVWLVCSVVSHQVEFVWRVSRGIQRRPSAGTIRRQLYVPRWRQQRRWRHVQCPITTHVQTESLRQPWRHWYIVTQFDYHHHHHHHHHHLSLLLARHTRSMQMLRDWPSTGRWSRGWPNGWTDEAMPPQRASMLEIFVVCT